MKIDTFTEPLYRADVRSLYGNQLPVTADDVYGIQFNKYFTLQSVETIPYQRRGETQMYVYTWNPTPDLQLIDMFDPDTREEVYQGAPRMVRNSLDIAFPFDGTHVKRVSDQETVEDDNLCLSYICSLGYDGYITRTREGVNTFHSEVGVCKESLRKLEMREPPVQGSVPPSIETGSATQSRLTSGMKGMKLFGGKRVRKTRRTKKSRKSRKYSKRH